MKLGELIRTSILSLSTAPQAVTTVTIANGQSLSGVADLRLLGVPVAIQMDAAWDTNAVTFQISYDNVVWTNLFVGGVEETIAGVVAATIEPLIHAHFLAARYLKVRSGTSGAPVAQVGDTIITIIARPM